MSGPRVVVFDYGFGNVRSAQNSLLRLGADASISADPAAALSCDGLVVPGVGAYAACAAGLRAAGGDGIIVDRVDRGAPVLGVCVGMQIMFDVGDEHGVRTPGLGLWPGEVTRLHAPILPHMGWNTVTPPATSRLFHGVGQERFYFVHSYAARKWSGDPADATWSHYGEDFLAAVESGPVWATQFHPEKSGDAGLAVLGNWLATLR